MTLPQFEITRRAFALLPYLVTTDPNRVVMFIPGRPVDASLLPSEEEIGAKVPEPSILHSIAKCEPCGIDIWLGPNQMKVDGVRLCVICAAVADRMAGTTSTVYALNPTEADVPRRVTR